MTGNRDWEAILLAFTVGGVFGAIVGIVISA